MPDRANPISVLAMSDISLGASQADEDRVITNLINRGMTADSGRMEWANRQRKLSRLRFGVRESKTFPWPNSSNLAIPVIDYAIRKYKPMLMRLFVEPNPVVEFVGEDPEAIDQEHVAEALYNWIFKVQMDSVEVLSYTIDSMCHRGFSFVEVGWDYQLEYETRIVDSKAILASIPQEQPTSPGAPPAPPNPQQIFAILLQQYDLAEAVRTDKRVQNSLTKAVEQILAGKEFVTLAFRRVIKDMPAIYDRDPVQIIAPPRCTDPGQAEWIIVQHIFPLRKIQELEASGFFQRGTAEKIIGNIEALKRINDGKAQPGDEALTSNAQVLNNERLTWDEIERLWGVEDEDNILIWAVYHWHDYNKDNLAERVITYIHPKSKTKCRSLPFYYSFHRWPFIKFDFEKINRRWHSPRGISQLLMDVQLEIDAQHNARIDGMTLRNAPAWQIPLLAGFKARNFRVSPGTVIHVPGGAQLQPLIQDRGAFPEQVSEENLLRTIGEQYVGIFDAAITSPLANTKARTATEISAVVQYQSATATLDAILFQDSMRRLHEMVWELWQDLGPDEIFLKVLGRDKETGEPELKRIRKSEINKKFKLIPTGTIANTNRAIELSNAHEAVSMYINDQSGCINPRELRNWHLGLLTQPRWLKRILNSPQEMAQLQTINQAAAALNNPDLGPRIMASMRSSVPVPQEEPPRQEIAQSGQSGYGAQQP